MTLRDAVRRLPAVTRAVGEKRGTVGFLQGCVQRAYFGDVNAATVAVLAAEGFEVHAPRAPRCCGALGLHAGQEEDSLPLAKATIEAFEEFDHVVVNAAGCGSAIKDYGHLLRDDPEWSERAAALAARARDVHELLAEHPPRAKRHPVELTVAYHDACHLAHAQKVRAQPRQLLRTIPGLTLVEPAEWELCCGSAGIYNLTRPEAAEPARRAQGRQPAGDRRRGDRRREPRLHAADRRAPAAQGPPAAAAAPDAAAARGRSRAATPGGGLRARRPGWAAACARSCRRLSAEAACAETERVNRAVFLKAHGTGDAPLADHWLAAGSWLVEPGRTAFPRRPRMASGDRLVLYASVWQRIFGVAEVHLRADARGPAGGALAVVGAGRAAARRAGALQRAAGRGDRRRAALDEPAQPHPPGGAPPRAGDRGAGGGGAVRAERWPSFSYGEIRRRS